jgi:hypothetical protein
MQSSVTITTSESHSDGLYLIQHYVITFVGNVRHIGGFLRAFRFPLDTNKTDRNDIIEILLKVALNTIPRYINSTYIY